MSIGGLVGHMSAASGSSRPTSDVGPLFPERLVSGGLATFRNNNRAILQVRLSVSLTAIARSSTVEFIFSMLSLFAQGVDAAWHV
jgi:hypothetical protein